MKPACEVCGSQKIIPDVRIMDQGQHSDGKLKVVVYGNPRALLFKERVQGELKASVCGECGHTELKVVNPKALYQAYMDSLK